MNAQTRSQDISQTLFSPIKEYLMVKKITKFDILIAIIILCSMAMSACGSVPAAAGVLPISQSVVEPPPNLPPVMGPEAARDAALDFILKNLRSSAPSPDLIWVGGEAPPSELVGSSTFQFVSDDWTIRVSFSLVAPDKTIYTVVVQREKSGFVWEGLVDAYGQVVTTSIGFESPSPTPEAVEPEPTPTSEPTPTQEPTPETNQEPCNAVKFIFDVSIPDGTSFAPNVDFTKVWRLKNVGRCTWNGNYEVIFIDGAQMGAIKAIALPTRVKTSETVDISVSMTSPDKEGDYFSFWMLRSDDGEIFGLGENANKSFWVSIQVNDPRSSTPPPEKIFAWEGYIWDTDFGAQFDDYFERTDLGQPLFFGIESMDTELSELIASLRDSGKMVRLEGILYSNVIDYNGSQILVTKIVVIE